MHRPTAMHIHLKNAQLKKCTNTLVCTYPLIFLNIPMAGSKVPLLLYTCTAAGSKVPLLLYTCTVAGSKVPLLLYGWAYERFKAESYWYEVDSIVIRTVAVLVVMYIPEASLQVGGWVV